ncbi:MAG TPA: serine/threonine-protein kinase [Planctomycetota bacterium]|nr:serine/threonine-protein kinase [Planctomycetota bacterium]
MSETIRMPTPDEDKGNVDVTSKPPSSTNSQPPANLSSVEQTIKADAGQEPKSDSRTQGGTPKKGGASTKSRLDDIPAEAAAFVDDPTKQLGSYVLVKQIGKGGMGAVWKAWDKKLTRWVAIKFLLVSEEEDIARFQREAKLAARLRHPNIAPIYEVGEAPATQAGDQTRHYLAMEYIDGQTMSAATNLPIPEILDLFMKVAQGIEAAHKAGVVHRDLKPANVMLTSDKWPYVMDFGLAKAIQAESSLSVSGAVMGTPAYMPPEQAQGQLDKIDGQSDVYSLGATIYAVLCKKQPFTGQTPMEILMKVCKDEPPSLKSHNPDIPDEVEKIVLKAMAKDKSDRYATAQALADDIKRYLSNQEIEAKGPSSLKLAAKKVKRNIWPLIVGAIVLVAGGVIAALAMRPPVKAQVSDSRPPLPPVVQNPNPPVEDSSARKAAEWYAAWIKLTESIDYDDWKAGDAGLVERVNRHLLILRAEAPLRQADVYDWFDRQTTKAENQFGRLGGGGDEKRGSAARLVAWYDMIEGAAKGVDFLKRQMDSALKIRGEAARIANYKGSFTLRIFVGPYAELTKLTRNGKEVPLSQRVTPLILGGLEIGNFELELSHPQLGKKVEKISEQQLKDGKAYQISGRFQDAKLRMAELP